MENINTPLSFEDRELNNITQIQIAYDVTLKIDCENEDCIQEYLADNFVSSEGDMIVGDKTIKLYQDCAPENIEMIKEGVWIANVYVHFDISTDIYENSYDEIVRMVKEIHSNALLYSYAPMCNCGGKIKKGGWKLSNISFPEKDDYTMYYVKDF